MQQRQFLKAMKYLRKEQCTIPTLSYNGATADNDSDKANMLNNFSHNASTLSCLPLLHMIVWALQYPLNVQKRSCVLRKK